MQVRRGPWLEREVNAGVERVVYLVAFALIVASRLPEILLKGRFWAEEGNVFFVAAWIGPWWKALLAPYGGYLDLVPNIGALVAYHVMPLSAAPYGSSAVALAVQCIPAILIVASRDSWLQPRFAMGAALLLIGMPIAADEVWISSIGCTAHLALAAAVVLALGVPRAGLLAFQCGVLLLAALTAPGCWVLTVLFAVRAILERSKERALQGLVLFAGVLLQLALFYSDFGRAMSITPSVLGAVVFTKHVLLPFLGVSRADEIISGLAAQYTEQGGPIWSLGLSVGLFIGLAGLAFRYLRQPPIWFILAAAIIAASGYVGAFDPDKSRLISVWNGARYAVAPQILFGLALLSWSRLLKDWTRYPAGILTVWLLVIDLMGHFHKPLSAYYNGPAWRDEVAQWRLDPNHTLQLWPPAWTVKLPPRQVP